MDTGVIIRVILMLMVLVMIMVAMKVTMMTGAIEVSCDNPGSLSSEYMITVIR